MFMGSSLLLYISIIIDEKLQECSISVPRV